MDSLPAAIARFNTQAVERGWVQYCDPANAFVAPECEDLVALWRAACEDRELPSRRDFSIRALKPYLARLVLIERMAMDPPQFKFRLVGTIVTQTLDERTGQDFAHETATAEQTERWTASAQLSLTARRPLRFPIRIEGKDVGEMVSLPLADEDGTPRYILAYGRYEPTRDWSGRDAAFAKVS